MVVPAVACHIHLSRLLHLLEPSPVSHAFPLQKLSQGSSPLQATNSFFRYCYPSGGNASHSNLPHAAFVCHPCSLCTVPSDCHLYILPRDHRPFWSRSQIVLVATLAA
uniref:Uncharacterized protein n=1 Tax=Cacopsylla melanoneura TaxID=428564 RepID=A0A8D8U0T8_9HEMI